MKNCSNSSKFGRVARKPAPSWGAGNGHRWEGGARCDVTTREGAAPVAMVAARPPLRPRLSALRPGACGPRVFREPTGRLQAARCHVRAAGGDGGILVSYEPGVRPRSGRGALRTPPSLSPGPRWRGQRSRTRSPTEAQGYLPTNPRRRCSSTRSAAPGL